MHHLLVQLPFDLGVGAEEDHADARLRLLDLQVLHDLVKEGSDRLPVDTLIITLVVTNAAGTVDQEGEINQAIGGCDRRGQIGYIVCSPKLDKTVVCELIDYFVISQKVL